MIEQNEARERVLEVAERLFAQRGYASVTLRDVGKEVGIRHASLYYHVPGGKEELFLEVSRRMFIKHKQGMHNAIEGAGMAVRNQLYAVAEWLLSQPPMDLIRMLHSDLPALKPQFAQELSFLAYDTMIAPIEETLHAAVARGEIDHSNPALIAGGLLGMIESLYAVPEEFIETSRKQMAHELIDVMMDGLRPR